MGKVVEFPRKLEWSPIEVHVGAIRGTQLVARIEKDLNGGGYVWAAMHGQVVIGHGQEDDLEAAKEAVRTCFTEKVNIVHFGNGQTFMM